MNKSNRIELEQCVLVDCDNQELNIAMKVDSCIYDTDAVVRKCHAIAAGGTLTIDLTRVASDCLPGYVDFQSLTSVLARNNSKEQSLELIRPGPHSATPEEIAPLGSFLLVNPAGWPEVSPWEITLNNSSTEDVQICFMLTGQSRP